VQNSYIKFSNAAIDFRLLYIHPFSEVRDWTGSLQKPLEWEFYRLHAQYKVLLLS